MYLVCSWNEVGMSYVQVSSSPFCTRPFWRMPIIFCRGIRRAFWREFRGIFSEPQKKGSKKFLREAKPGGFQARVFPVFFFSGKVQIVSRTLSGLFLVCALNRPRKRKRTNRENPRTIPEQIGKIPEKSGKSKKGQKRKDESRSGSPPV